MAAMSKQASLPLGGASSTTTVDGRAAIELRGITKRFPGVVANNDISLDVLAGEIHVLLGENGAGKSTLIGILAGLQQPDAGSICVHGRSVRIASPRESLDLGIGTVFQHMQLVPSLTVLENLMLGESSWRPLQRRPALERFRELSALLGVSIDADAPVARLALGEQQQVEIMHALWRGASVLILDEPTSMLTPQGVHRLGEVMKRLRDKGVAIIFITHKMREACALGDRISVLRLGRPHVRQEWARQSWSHRAGKPYRPAQSKPDRTARGAVVAAARREHGGATRRMRRAGDQL
jgi:ABC-type uncharacterized transport system ATPase subunit